MHLSTRELTTRNTEEMCHKVALLTKLGSAKTAVWFGLPAGSCRQWPHVSHDTVLDTCWQRTADDLLAWLKQLLAAVTALTANDLRMGCSSLR